MLYDLNVGKFEELLEIRWFLRNYVLIFDEVIFLLTKFSCYVPEMTLNEQLCPFVHWDDIKEHIPDIYFSLKGKSIDYSWFVKAPKYSTFRVNISKYSPEEVLTTFKQQYLKEAKEKCMDPPVAFIQPLLPDCIVIGPWKKSFEGSLNESLGDVIIDVPCANAVLRGADVFAPAILGLSASAKAGDEVNIFADLDKKCLRGFTKKFINRKYLVGRGILKVDRDTLFKNNANLKGVGVEVIENISGVPRINLPTDYGILQNLPSIVCGHLFSNVDGHVLDMCAAPGNKTSHIAAILRGKGRVVALDKTASKVRRLSELCSELGLTNVDCHVFDSTKCVRVMEGKGSGGEEEGLAPPFRPASFPAVLLDPPCSGLGQRPALANTITLSHLRSYLPLQQKLFRKGVEVLEEGGVLVYSTCTITIEENEGMVAWALQEYPSLSLQEISPSLGSPGLQASGLSEEQRLLVNRFGSLNPTSTDQDTIGFFIAKFIKNKVC